jgi:hypothetical protein
VTDSASTGAGTTGAAASQLSTLRESTTPQEVLDTLRRQGIGDLEALARALLEQAQQHAVDPEDDSPSNASEVDFFVSDHYVVYHEQQ